MTTNPAVTADRAAIREAFASKVTTALHTGSYRRLVMSLFDAALAATPAPEAPTGHTASAAPRLFVLRRDDDVSGVSGLGGVAEGVEFSDGTVVLRWLRAGGSTAVYDSLARMVAIHGHDGRTRVVWFDARLAAQPEPSGCAACARGDTSTHWEHEHPRQPRQPEPSAPEGLACDCPGPKFGHRWAHLSGCRLREAEPFA